MNYYVYYKIDPAQAKGLAPKIAELFDLVKAQTGIHGRWMRRRDDPTTYMEVYEGVEDERGFEALLEAAGARLGVARKVERFVCA